MSNDNSAMFTKDQNMKAGRKGFFDWKGVKITAIGSAAYGDYILQNKRRGKNENTRTGFRIRHCK